MSQQMSRVTASYQSILIGTQEQLGWGKIKRKG